MTDRLSLLDSITGAFVPIHRDGHKFVFAFGLVTLWMAVAADMGMSLIVTLNGLRLVRRDSARSCAGAGRL